MVSLSRSIPKERQPLLSRASTPNSLSEDGTDATDDEYAPPPLNDFSKSDICWILAGLWSAVFLGALDGKFHGPICRSNISDTIPYCRHHRRDIDDAHWKLLQSGQSVIIHRYFLPFICLLLHATLWQVHSVL